MKTININPLSEHYTLSIKEGIKQGYIIVCCQRPISGSKTWNQQSIGNGMFYAYGTEEHMKQWINRDIALIKLQTNEDIKTELTNLCKEEGTTIEEVLKDNQTTIKELANDMDYMYI